MGAPRVEDQGGGLTPVSSSPPEVFKTKFAMMYFGPKVYSTEFFANGRRLIGEVGIIIAIP